MSIKINAFCRKDRISTDQTTIVYLRFTKNRRSRYVSTGIRVPISEWNFENQAPQPSNQHLQYQIYEQIESYQRQIRRMEVLDMPITLEAILSSDKHAAGCTIASFLQQVIEQTERENRLSSASRYKVILAQLKQAHLSHLRFEELTLDHLHLFEHVLRKLGNKPNSIVTKMSVFKAIYNRALSNRVFICSENPFVMILIRVINNKQIAGNNLAYLFDNQFDVFDSKSNDKLSFYQDLKVDIKALDDCLTKRDLLHISRINTVPNYGNGGKIYSALANLRKPIRKHIMYKGENLVEVSDVSCAHFTMLPVIFKRHNIAIPNEELLRYRELTQKGDLYSAVVEGTDMLRADIKQTFQPFLSIKHKAQFLYGQDSEETRKRETICEYFEAHFPSIFNALLLWHTHTEQSIKSVANEVESDIMNPICNQLIADGLHPFRIHDAIYLPQNEQSKLTIDIRSEVMSRINREML